MAETETIKRIEALRSQGTTVFENCTFEYPHDGLRHPPHWPTLIIMKPHKAADPVVKRRVNLDKETIRRR